MRIIVSLVLLLHSLSLIAQDRTPKLATNNSEQYGINKSDWMLKSKVGQAEIYQSEDRKKLIIYNGLLERVFQIQPNLTCIDFSNLSSGQQLLRATGPEAQLTINSKIYNVGGLHGQKERAYLLSKWLPTLYKNEDDFQFVNFEVTSVSPYINWNRKNNWALNAQQPSGKKLTLIFKSNIAALSGITVKINYEIYDGIPLLCKWLTIKNDSKFSIVLNQVKNEVLAVHEEESSVAGDPKLIRKQHGLYIESNYAFNNSMNARLSDQTTHWNIDSTYTSQVNYEYKTPCLLEIYPEHGIGVKLAPNSEFKSIRTNELLLDNYDRERNGLAQKLMYKTIAPWATQNPIFMHLISTDSIVVKNAVDQCSETGYEGIILSFGSGINMEDISKTNINNIKKLVDYAHSKGVLMGGYSLFSSRKINDKEDVIDPKTGKADVHALFGAAPCLGSEWGLAYLDKLKLFMQNTGLDIFENDGPYPGDVCASTKHPGHKNLADSQWSQMELQKGFYRWCSENGIYVNAPDWYFLDGTNKIALGYREVNFSLPREQQKILNRQNIYDGTWEKMPSMSWGFVPLTQYHGGGEEATLEPLKNHLDTYEQLMMQYYGSGIQACYRGPRLYDSDSTKDLVKKVISWYKKYRRILNSPVIHLRRPDGRDWDGILHVDPSGDEKGLAMFYNPLDQDINRKLKLPLYYTGLNKKVNVSIRGNKFKSYKIDDQRILELEINIPKNGYTWVIFK